MVNSFYNVSGAPVTGSAGASAVIRSEYALIAAAFDKMPALTASTIVGVNSGGTALANYTTTGTGTVVALATSPTITTPTITTPTITTPTITSGTIGAASGSAGSPSINFTSDTDNGLYYTGTNAWALAVGGVGGVFLSKIDATGNVSIGGNSAPAADFSLVVSGPTSAAELVNGSSGSPTAVVWNASTSGDNIFVNFTTEGGSGTVRGSIDFNRGGSAVRYNTTSSQELKTAIVDLTPEQHSELSAIVDSVQLREFEWRDTPGVKTFGVVTEELSQIYPDAVNGDGTQYDRSMLVFPLLAKCKALEDRLAALEAQIHG